MPEQNRSPLPPQPLPPQPGQPVPPAQPVPPYPQAAAYPIAIPTPPQHLKRRSAAGLFGIFLGALGIHNFYLGRNGRGAIQLVLTLLAFFSYFGIFFSAGAVTIAASSNRFNLDLLSAQLTGLGIGILFVFLSAIGFAVVQLWTFIEGILYLGSRSPRWSTDAQGRPLV